MRRGILAIMIAGTLATGLAACDGKPAPGNDAVRPDDTVRSMTAEEYAAMVASQDRNAD